MDFEQEFAIQLSRVSRQWRKQLDQRLKHMDLTQARWVVLLQLSQSGPLSQRELADKIGVEGPTLVRILDSLQRAGLIDRRECGEDRRVKHVHLDEAAGPVLKEITKIATELRRELLAGVPPEQLRAAARVLQIIGDRLEASASE